MASSSRFKITAQGLAITSNGRKENGEMRDSLPLRTLFRNLTGNFYSGQNLNHMAIASQEAEKYILYFTICLQKKTGASTIRKKKRMNIGGQLVVSVIICSSF